VTEALRAAAWATLAITLAAGCAGRPRPLDDPQRWRSGECRARFTIDHEGSPLSELLELGGWRSGPQDRFPAAVIDPTAQRPVTATARLRLQGQPIAWFSPMLDAVVLDGAAFAPLRRADATTAEAGVRQVVGRVVPRAREAMGERTVLELLLRIDAIQSYWHVGADLCLTSELETNGTYRAELQGVHHSVAPRRALGSRTLETRFVFAVEIDPEGEISVEGLRDHAQVAS
jgi:hypothetical protein